MTQRLAVFLLLTVLTGSAACAETLVASRTIRSQTVLSATDLSVVPGAVAGALMHPDAAIGMEARVVLYAGRPIRAEDVGPPALVERNQTVTLLYRHGGLTIATEGRSLARAAAGEQIRAMNVSSRTTITGQVDPTGRVIVQNAAPRP